MSKYTVILNGWSVSLPGKVRDWDFTMMLERYHLNGLRLTIE